jgi:hypothetical protein
MPPPNLPTSSIKIKCVIVQWITPNYGGWGVVLIFANVTNPFITKVAGKSTCLTHPPIYNDYIVD